MIRRRSFLVGILRGLTGLWLLSPVKGRPVEPAATRLIVDVPVSAENGAMVPLQAESHIPDTRELLIFVEPNPNPQAARFEFLPGALPRVSLRVRFNESGPVRVIAHTPSGDYGVRRVVKVMQGGCG